MHFGHPISLKDHKGSQVMQVARPIVVPRKANRQYHGNVGLVPIKRPQFAARPVYVQKHTKRKLDHLAAMPLFLMLAVPDSNP